MMKTKTMLTAICLLLLGQGVIAQQDKSQTVNSSNVSPTPLKSHIVKESVVNQNVVTNEVNEAKEEVNYPITVSYTRDQKNQPDTPRKIEDIELDIKNIKDKIDYVKNSPEMDEKAREEGWYTRNEILLENLEKEKSNLLKK